jgi:hypothetical protein
MTRLVAKAGRGLDLRRQNFKTHSINQSPIKRQKSSFLVLRQFVAKRTSTNTESVAVASNPLHQLARLM